MPAITVLVPVRNAGRWLAPSLASLWRQSFRDFEVVAVDDGSTDGSAERLERWARREPRLRVIHLQPSGLPAALNAGLARARAALVARHDADDLSHRDRLALQQTFLSARPEVGVVGARLGLLPRDFAGVGMRRWCAWHNALLSHAQMARETLVDSPLAHATALLRRGPLERVGGWAERGWPEDLDLWLRLLEAGVRFAKLPRTLYAWRQHEGNATRRDARCGRDRYDALRLEWLARGCLRDATAVSVVGVGTSLERWCGRLGERGYRVRRHTAGRPAPPALEALSPPAVLVFGAAPARARWRAALEACGWREREQFVFVA